MHCFAFTTIFLGIVAAASLTSSRNLDDTSIVPGAKKDYTRLDTATETRVTVTQDNILNGKFARPRTFSNKILELNSSAVPQVNISIVNNLGDGVNSYFSAQDSDGSVFFLAKDGSLIHPSSGGSTTPVPITEDLAIPMPGTGESLNLAIPGSFSAGRLYFMKGELSFSMVFTGNDTDGLVQPSLSLEDPARDLNWGFVEMTLTKTGEIWSNISYVDFIGIIMFMALRYQDGTDQEVVGLGSEGVAHVCEGLRAQAEADGRDWDAMCIAREDGTPLRVLSPENYAEVVQKSDFDDYWDQYVDEVWAKYSNESLTIDTQAEAGEVECRVNEGGDLLECAGDNLGYPKPTAPDILGCNTGPFGILETDNPVHYAVVPRLCAAFARSTLLIEGGSYQPGQSANEFYTANSTFHYSRIVHDNQIDGKGYAFAYDDVVAEGEPDTAGLITSQDPDLLTFFIGGSQ